MRFVCHDLQTHSYCSSSAVAAVEQLFANISCMAVLEVLLESMWSWKLIYMDQ